MKWIFVMCIALTSQIVWAKNTNVVMRTNEGDIELELFNDKAPKSVANFLDYVKSGHYKKTIFHRVIPNFMIQGGGFDKDLVEKKTNPPIENEAKLHQLKNEVGTISYARTEDPNSATSQFFINVKDNSFLDYSLRNPGYAVFGKVIKGMDTVKKIEMAKTGNRGMMDDVPLKPIEILDIFEKK